MISLCSEIVLISSDSRLANKPSEESNDIFASIATTITHPIATATVS